MRGKGETVHRKITKNNRFGWRTGGGIPTWGQKIKKVDRRRNRFTCGFQVSNIPIFQYSGSPYAGVIMAAPCGNSHVGGGIPTWGQNGGHKNKSYIYTDGEIDVRPPTATCGVIMVSPCGVCGRAVGRAVCIGGLAPWAMGALLSWAARPGLGQKTSVLPRAGGQKGV